MALTRSAEARRLLAFKSGLPPSLSGEPAVIWLSPLCYLSVIFPCHGTSQI